MPLPIYLMSNFPSVRPSLNLQFDSQPTPADMTSHLASVGATFSRASIGTYTDANGIIQEATAGQARPNYSTEGVHEGLLIEESRTNLLKSSEDISTTDWSIDDVSVTVNQDISPSGDASADKITVNTQASGHHVLQSVSVTNGTSYTFSVYAKQSTQKYLALRGLGATVIFDLDAGTVSTSNGNEDSSSIEDVGNGWYRCIFTDTSTTTSSQNFFIGINDANDTTVSFTGNGTDSLFVWGAQLEEGSFPTSYIPTIPTFSSRASDGTYFDSSGVLQTASTDEERIDHKYIDGQWVEAGLLLEGASTNLVTDSEDFDNVSWSKVNSPTITVNDSVAPDGTTTADLLTDSNSGLNAFIGDTITVSNDSDNYCASLFIKKELSEAYTVIQLFFSGGTAKSYTIRIRKDTGDFADIGTAWSGSGANAIDLGVEDYGDYWRIYLVGANNGTGNTSASFRIFMAVTSANLTTTGSVTVWGAQFEKQSQRTSYIATSGGTATRSADVYTTATKVRSADVCTITGTAFTDFYNQDEGTIFSHVKLPSKIDVINQGIFTFGLSSDNDTFLTNYSIGTGELRLLVKDLSDTVVSNITQSSAPSPNDIVKIASKYGSSYGLFIGGSDIGSDSITHTLSFNELFIGKLKDDYFNGSIKKLIYFPRQLTDNELIKLTQ